MKDPRLVERRWASLDRAADLRKRALATLRLAGPVTPRREGTLMYSAAADEHVRQLLGEAVFHTDHVERGLGDDHQHDRLLAQKT